MPKVSICIPAYNKVIYLKKTIDSVLLQTYTDYEIVITDDSPENMIMDLVAAYNLPDRIKYYKNERVQGSPENWNEAIRRSSGEYIKILHHDDWLNSKDSLAKYVQLLDENPAVDFAFSATTAMAANKNWDHVLNESELTSLKKDILVLYRNNLIGAPSTTIFRRNVNLFFDNNLKWLVDIEFYIRMLSRNKDFIYTSKMLTVTYLAEGRVTDECENNKEVEVFEYFYLFDKLKPFLGKGKSKGYRNALLKLIAVCKKYSLKNTSEIRAAGYKGKIPLHVISFIKLNSFHSITGRAYLKMLKATVSK